MSEQRVDRQFFEPDTQTVAKKLLGKLVVRRYRGRTFSGRITEVEACLGENDAASHASRGLTKRTKPMFGSPGRAYIYLIYGIYHCLNIVTEPEGTAGAVLIRSIEPLQGITTRTDGPGKLTRALHITRDLNEENLLTSKRLYIIDDGYVVKTADIVAAPRIGVAYAGQDALLPWRYSYSLLPE